MIRIWLINFSCYDSRSFDDAKQALERMKLIGFECAAHLQDYGTVFSYSPLGGLQVYHEAFEGLRG
jgi:hypothetical protein